MQRIFCLAVMVMLVAACATTAPAQMQRARDDALMQETRQIGMMMFAYATDNGGAYPTGKSSTEIFQKLLDGGYASDSSVFYCPLPGKVAPTSKILRPENVSFDVTAGVESTSSDLTPMVYLTGFKISYAAGASAQPVDDAAKKLTGISVVYKGNNAVFLREGADHAVANFIAAGFTADQSCQQLTPSGPMAH